VLQQNREVVGVAEELLGMDVGAAVDTADAA